MEEQAVWTKKQNQFRAPERTDPELLEAIWHLDCISKDEALDLLFRGRVTAMLVFLRTYVLYDGFGWKEASMFAAATVAGRGTHLAQNIRSWTQKHLRDHQCLPVNLYGAWKKSIISDEDFSLEIQLHLQNLQKEHITPTDVQEYLNLPNVLSRLGRTKPVTLQTARKWLNGMGYRYGKVRQGMYVDGHERDDVVFYRQHIFLPLWLKLEKRMDLESGNT